MQQDEMPKAIFIPKRQRLINIVLEFFDTSVPTDVAIYFIVKAVLPAYGIVQWLVLLAVLRELFNWFFHAKLIWERDYIYPMPPPTEYPFDFHDKKE